MKVIALLAVLINVLVDAKQCNHLVAPIGAVPEDNNYSLKMAGDPDRFLPGELYTVILQGVNNGEGPAPFTGFYIWIEASTKTNSDLSLGSFQAYDVQTELYDKCEPAVVNSTAHYKTEIQILWSAPANVTEACIKLCARVAPVFGVRNDSWTTLVKEICAIVPVTTMLNRQPPVVEPCCACDEAKYEVVFEGLWSRYTHPRDFPPESVQAHFGDMIGASHTAQHRVWQEGRVASAGLRQLADNGSTTALEKELKDKSDLIRTIIKARGHSRQRTRGTGSEIYAVFRVNPRHHLMSLAAKLSPSPDWFVGLSGLELCNRNCTWTSSATFSLFPYDAGTDDGISYMSERDPTTPPNTVRALGPDWPNDKKSPFHNSRGVMKPFARVGLKRLRLYEKSCELYDWKSAAARYEADIASPCATYNWGEWTPCSVTCGEGMAIRQRHYIWPQRSVKESCREKLTDYKECMGPRFSCRVISENEPDPAEHSGPCAMSQWSNWSPCSAPKCGVKVRTRNYLLPRAHKRCHVGLRASTLTDHTFPCESRFCNANTDIGEPYESTRSMNYVDRSRGGFCRVTFWGDWSPCSSRCGEGKRLRTRLILYDEDRKVRQELTDYQMNRWKHMFAGWQGINRTMNYTPHSDTKIAEAVALQLYQCENILTEEITICTATMVECRHEPKSVLCTKSVDKGPCFPRLNHERWAYNAKKEQCELFVYTGCGGNTNNFITKESCETFCRGVTIDSIITTTTTVKPTTKKSTRRPIIIAKNITTVVPNIPRTPVTTTKRPVKSKNRKSKKIDRESMQNDMPTISDMNAITHKTRQSNCKLTKWSDWGNCIEMENCSYGVKFSYRKLLTTYNHECNVTLMKTRSCRPDRCRPHIIEDKTRSSLKDSKNTKEQSKNKLV